MKELFNKKKILIIIILTIIVLSITGVLIAFNYSISKTDKEIVEEEKYNNDKENTNQTETEPESEITTEEDKTEEEEIKEENQDKEHSNTIDKEQENTNNTPDKPQEEQQKEEIEEIPQEIEPPIVETYQTKNTALAQEIIDLYRVSVLYDSKAFYTENGISATKTTEVDGEAVNKTLIAIKSALQNIPQSILDTMRLDNGYSIHILKQLPGGQSGLAVFSPYGSQRMIIDSDLTLTERIVYHETFHLMERYIYHKNGQANAFTNWEKYNPVGFTYGGGGSTYTSYDKATNKEQIAFVSVYAKTSDMEDRAELFADLMFRTRKYDYMNEGYATNEKAKYLDQVIDQYFGNIPGAYWERWITR